jgi:hypothetical protein
MKKFQWKNALFSYFFVKKIREENCLRKFCFSLDSDPELDPDPD